MFEHLNNVLRHLFVTQIDEIQAESQVRFQPPGPVWHEYVKALGARRALNIYMVDLRENRKLRSNRRERTPLNGVWQEEPAPNRVACHYLITAWSPAKPSDSVEPTLDEQALLYQALAVLMQNAPLNPSRIYPPGSAALNAVPDLIRRADLPTDIVPVEGFPKLAEFWGAMGAGSLWKPAIYLVVTLPVALRTEIAGPMVTTRITEYRRTGQPDTAEIWIQIGGHVLDATVNPPVPVAKAWVRLEDTDGEPVQTTETDQLGRFTFNELRPGQYQLNWRATGHPIPPAPHPIDVPSPTGEYDLKFE